MGTFWRRHVTRDLQHPRSIAGRLLPRRQERTRQNARSLDGFLVSPALLGSGSPDNQSSLQDHGSRYTGPAVARLHSCRTGSWSGVVLAVPSPTPQRILSLEHHQGCGDGEICDGLILACATEFAVH